jgi:hypothetical protein
LFALCVGRDAALRVARAMETAVQAQIGGEAHTYISAIPSPGARVISTCAS